MRDTYRRIRIVPLHRTSSLASDAFVLSIVFFVFVAGYALAAFLRRG